MSPKHTVCFCNNRGGVGKTFMAFQTACEAARARPHERVLVVDFSLYSDQTALLLGGSARLAAVERHASALFAGMPTMRTDRPEESVALGAAAHAQRLQALE